jgi:uncharacterized protein YbjT (DUF2867 family)
MTKVVVIGGSGLIGSQVVQRLTEQGHGAIPASPSSGVNIITGEGVAEVLDGADVLVDVSNAPSWEPQAVMDFFTTSTGNLLSAAQAAGVRHYVALSVVGTDRNPESSYLNAKHAQEKLIKESGVPFSIVHATQFFEFVSGIADSGTEGNTVHVPDALIRPIAAADVASAVARTAIGEPINGEIEVAGPETFRFDELMTKSLAFNNDTRTVVASPEARYFGAVLKERSLVPDEGDALLADTTFGTWLTAGTAAQK